VSTATEIQALLRQTEALLRWLGKPPTVITVSRSSRDDYCPPYQVEEIQEGLLGLLHTQYRNLTITKGYLDSEEDD